LPNSWRTGIILRSKSKSSLQRQYFPNSHPGPCSDREQGAKGLPGCGDDLRGLVSGEASNCFLRFLRSLMQVVQHPLDDILGMLLG